MKCAIFGDFFEMQGGYLGVTSSSHLQIMWIFDMFKIMIHKHGKISEILKYSSHSAQMMEYIRQSCITMLLMWIMLCWCIYLALYLGQFYDKQLLNIMNTRMISRSFNTNVKLGSKLHGLWELYFVNECCFKQSYFSKCSCFDK